jgi:hypothetical protein
MHELAKLFAHLGDVANIPRVLLAVSGAMFIVYVLTICVLVAWQKVRDR